MSFNRTSLYSECQVEHWKKGTPPHKLVCGNALRDEDIHVQTVNQKPIEDIEERIPPADPGFTRSPALLTQISFLKRPPYVDYVVRRLYTPCCTSE